MTGRLEGKVALVTGGGAGIGRATAERFAAEGATVRIAEIDEESGRAAADAIDGATFVRTDVTDEASTADAVADLDRLDVLFCCAGGSLAEDAPVTSFDWQVWDRTIDLNLKGTIITCRVGIPLLQAAGGGSIVTMSSILALKGFPAHVYSAAKGGVSALTRALAADYAGDGIRANAIAPGMVLTERVAGRAETTDPWPTHPFAVGEPVDIANIAVFLASDESRMITGATIPAEGGLTAY